MPAMLWAAIAFLEFLLGAFALTALFNRYHLNPHANPAVRAARWFAERLSKWRVPPYGGLILWAAGGTALIVGLGIVVNAVLPLLPTGLGETVAVAAALGAFAAMALGGQALAWIHTQADHEEITEHPDRAFGEPMAPDLIVPIKGFRLWRVVGDALFSLSTVGDPHLVYWQPGRPHAAICGLGQGHRPPHPSCTCGIYASRTAERVALDLVAHLRTQGIPVQSAFAIGPVKLWGRVCEHEHGWRAEYAYPGDPLVLLGDVSDADLEVLAARYGVRCVRGPALRAGALRDFLERFPGWHSDV